MSTLYYVHDPMCSWCWGFRPAWLELQSKLPSNIQIKYVLGGLAPDSDKIMPQVMQNDIRGYWKTVQARIPGTRFNFDFWDFPEKSKPRRSTYPACRAVIAVTLQDANIEHEVILAIQQSYYLHAKNPSDDQVLADVAEFLALDRARFEADLVSETVNQKLLADIEFSRRLGALGFPSLILEVTDEHGNKQKRLIPIDYNNSDNMLTTIL